MGSASRWPGRRLTRFVRAQHRDVIIALLLGAALLPLAMSALLSWLWWTSLHRPWLFLVIGGVGLYALMIFFVTLAFTGIGIAGRSPGPQPLLGPVEIRFLFLLAAFVVLSVPILWLLKLLFAKS